jgi:hypothetical protein
MYKCDHWMCKSSKLERYPALKNGQFKLRIETGVFIAREADPTEYIFITALQFPLRVTGTSQLNMLQTCAPIRENAPTSYARYHNLVILVCLIFR